MEPVSKYSGMIQFLEEAFEKRYKRKDVNLTGLLFARPKTAFVKKQILPNLSFWHHRSDYYTDFFCPGYFRKEAGIAIPFDDLIEVDAVDGNKWFYSDKAFVQFLNQFEILSKWKYSGGCDLLLTNVRCDIETRRVSLDLGTAISIHLDKAIKDDVYEDVAELYESIFEFAKNMNESTNDPCWEFSDEQGMRIVKGSLKDVLLSFLPKSLRPSAKKAFHVYVEDLRIESRAEQRIRMLASEWMVGPNRHKIDEFSDAVNNLHGDGEAPDEVETLIINMGRTDYPDGAELTKLHAQYLREKAAQEQD